MIGLENIDTNFSCRSGLIIYAATYAHSYVFGLLHSYYLCMQCTVYTKPIYQARVQNSETCE